MEALKKEQITPFYPYNLKVICGLHRKPAMFTLTGLASIMYGKRIKEMCSLRSDSDSERCGISEIKPILHPLSDLTKPIQHNGEEFVPIIELYSLYGRQPDGVEMICNQELGYVESHYYGGAVLKFNTDQPLENRYDYVQQLIKWKFAVDIPEHLWIDVNTLSENPYK